MIRYLWYTDVVVWKMIRFQKNDAFNVVDRSQFFCVCGNMICTVQ